MKTAYLDNNIIIEIEQGHIILKDLLQLIDSDIEIIYYSAAHLQEANEITGNYIEKQSRLQNRFQTIASITNNNYLFHELPSNIIHKMIELPEIIYKTISSNPIAQNSIKQLMSIVNEEQKQLFRDQLNINPLEINNYTPQQVIEQINERKALFGGFSFIEIIDKAVEMHPDGKSFGIHNKFAGLFELLDIIGYWKDKYNNKSNYARLWDSNHAYFSSFCDYFISDDKKTRNKTNVVFYTYGIKTKILSSKGES